MNESPTKLPEKQDHGERPGAYAVTESGTRTRSHDDEVNLALKLLALTSNATLTLEQLEAQGISLHRNTLRQWRDKYFPRRYAQIRRELGREVSEEVAGRALERALEADEAEQAYIQAALAKVEEVEPNHLAKNALALANAKSTNVEKAQLLRNQPTEIKRVNVEEAISTLERLGVAKRVESESKVIDVEPEED